MEDIYFLLAIVCYFIPLLVSLLYFIYCFISDFKHQQHRVTISEIIFAVVLCITPMLNFKALEIVLEDFNNHLKRK